MAGSSWWNPFSWGAEDPSLKSQVVTEPLKSPVGEKMSAYLTSEIGKGLPAYPGQLVEDFDPNAYNRYQDFISLDPNAWFDKAVGDPATTKFREDFLPDLREGFAGNLRGSGRFASEAGEINKFSNDLAVQREKANVTLPQLQVKMAADYKAMKDQDYMTQYKAWMATLPQMNPVLGQALDFLKGPTGQDTVSYLDPGKKGWFSDAVKMATDIWGMSQGAGGA